MTGAGNNTYLLIGDAGDAALVDAGVGDPQHLNALQQQLDAHQAKLTLVLVTHAHPDHASGASALAAEHRTAAFHKHISPEQDARYNVEWKPLDDGARILAGGQWLTAVHTPGHAADHLAFWHEPSRTLFSGDLVFPGAGVTIDPAPGGNLQRYLDSLVRVSALKPARLLPAHGEEISDAMRVLTEQLEHRRSRERQIIGALAAGRHTVESIAEYIYDGLHPALSAAARENVRAHLEKLRTEGRAIEHDARWDLQWKT